MNRCLAGAALLAVLPWSVAAPAPAQVEDPRSVERLRYGCESRISRRELTLFANGTLRLREEQEGELPRMRLAELGSVELAGYLARLAEEDLTEVDVRGPEASGDWVEICSLWLKLENGRERQLRFGRMDSLPLALGRLISVIDDMFLEVDRLAPRSKLPADYEARSGDRLRRFDGALFQVVAYTGDGAGLELEGIDEPLVVFIPVAALRDEFEELVERRP